MLEEIYSDTDSQVQIKASDGYCIIYIKDEVDDEAEICIPFKGAIHIANKIIEACR